jgi:DNA-binding GntR family transcriptional regulator
MRRVNHHSGDKLHKQLASLLREDILKRRLRIGENIPTENMLCQQHVVSKAVVRQAVGTLVAEGLLEKRAGKGTRVISAAGGKGVPFTTYMGDPVLEGNLKLTTSVVSKKAVRTPEALLTLFSNPNDNLFEICRLFSHRSKPVLLEVGHVSESACPGISVLNISGRGIPEVLEEHFNLRLARVTTTFSLELLDGAEARQLELEVGSRAIICNHQLFLADDVPVGHLRRVNPIAAPCLVFDFHRRNT